MIKKTLAFALLMLHGTCAMALELRFEPVAANVYAYIGDTGGRTAENQGLNANRGLIVTPLTRARPRAALTARAGNHCAIPTN